MKLKYSALLALPLLALETATAATGLWFFAFRVRGYHPVFREFYYRETPGWAGAFCVLLAATLLVIPPLRRGGWAAVSRNAFDWWPLAAAIPVLPLLFVPIASSGRIWAMLILIMAAAWGCYRYGMTLCRETAPDEGLPKPAVLTAPTAWKLVLGLTVLCLIRSVYMQVNAYHSLFLLFADWGEYAMNYLELAFGDGTGLRRWFVTAGHFNPVANGIMTAALWLCPSPYTMFVMNAVAIYSALPLLYLLGREYKLPPQLALFFSVCLALMPAVTHQSLSFFYGFHPINFLPSCLLLFFLFRARGGRIGMAVMFLLTLGIQETVAIFWLGYALYLLTRRRWTVGLLLALGMTLWFYLVAALVIPAVNQVGAEYNQTFHYHHLGDSLTGIVLSPLLRPRAFWGTLLAINNFEFAIFLLMPFLFLIRVRPALLVAGLPLLAGVCLQSSRDLQNVAFQYSIELNFLVILTALGSAAVLYREDRARLGGALAATMFGIVVLYLWIGLTFYAGKYPFKTIAERPNAGALVNFIRSRLPQGATVHASHRIRGMLLFDHPTRDLSEPALPGSFWVFDRPADSGELRQYDELRYRLAADPTVAEIAGANWYHLEYVIFAQMPEARPQQPLPFLIPVDDADFETFGEPIESPDPNLEVRVRPAREGLLVSIRLQEATDGDYRFRVTTGNRAHTVSKDVSYGLGLRPAFLVSAGTVFQFQVECPVKPEFATVELRP